MAHRQQQDFCRRVKAAFPMFFAGKRVLDVGSYEVNGSNRPLFTDCDYVGIDFRPGPGVDVVCKAHEFRAEPFDTIICTELLEHDVHWRETVENLMSLLGRGNLSMLIITCATGNRARHGDEHASVEGYYHNISLDELKQLTKGFVRYAFEVNEAAGDLYFWGIVCNQSQLL
jgi:Methyltransferase domain